MILNSGTAVLQGCARDNMVITCPEDKITTFKTPPKAESGSVNRNKQFAQFLLSLEAFLQGEEFHSAGRTGRIKTQSENESAQQKGRGRGRRIFRELKAEVQFNLSNAREHLCSLPLYPEGTIFNPGIRRRGDFHGTTIQ